MKAIYCFKLVACLCVLWTLFMNSSGSVSASSAPSHTHPIILFPTRSRVQQEWPHGIPRVLGSGNLTFHGGIVQHSPTSYLIFWGASWLNNGQLTADAQIVDNYFADMGGTSFENILTQYHDNSGQINNTHTLGGYYVDTTAPTTDSSCGGPTIEDAAIQVEANHIIAVKGWQKSTNAVFYVYTPNGDYINTGGYCSEKYFCAYHGWSYSYSMAYSAMPYPFSSGCQVPSSPNGNIYGDSLANVSSHEQFESITDVQLNAWYDSAGYEIGDKCAWLFPSGYTSLNNGGVFELQEEYSNASSSCVNSFFSWYGPAQIGGPGTTASAPSMVLDSVGHLNAVVEGPSNTLYTYWQVNAKWYGPAQIGGPGTTASAPSMVLDSLRHLNAVVEGPSNTLYFYWQVNAWWYGPAQIGGPGTTYSAPSIALDSVGHLNVMVEGPSNTLYTYWQIGTTWYGPVQIGGPGTTALSGVGLLKASEREKEKEEKRAREHLM